MNAFQKIYKTLLKEFDPQGWWPLIDFEGSNPTKTGSVRGYHPNDYALPKTTNQVFEICIGAILTQNTSWTSVEKALMNLKNVVQISASNLCSLDEDVLKSAIRPAGYFNQKAKKIKLFANFFSALKTIPSREELLSLWGVGNETADSILLYAFKVPVFVVDAYTKRVFARVGLCEVDSSYEQVQQMFHKSLSKNYELFNEYHALLVELAKRHCVKSNPRCDSCSLTKICRKIL